MLLASGTGFAPIKSIIEYAIARKIARPMALYWGCRTRADLYMDELAAGWVRDLSQAFAFVPVLSDARARADGWLGRTGFVHRAVMDDLPDLSGHEVYASGNPAMVDAARAEFSSRCGLPEDELLCRRLPHRGGSRRRKCRTRPKQPSLEEEHRCSNSPTRCSSRRTITRS